jgi:membrane protein implicated in regulation of membrane protease activity
MGTRAPMPRWYDIPVVWLGLQVLVMAAFLAAVRWLFPDLSGPISTIVFVGGLALIALAAYRLRRSLVARDARKPD